MKKIIIYLFIALLSYTNIFISSCFADALYTLDWKGDIYMIDDQWKISWYKDGQMLEEIPWVYPYVMDWWWSSDDWKQIYMPDRKDLKTVIVWKVDWTYKLMVAWWNYHLDIEWVETKKWQIDEIISRENSTEINFDDNKEWYYNLGMNFRRYKNWSIYFYQQKATWNPQKYVVDWEWVDKWEDNSILYITDDNLSSYQDSLNNKIKHNNDDSSQKILNNEIKYDKNKFLNIYYVILILIVSVSIIGELFHLYYKMKISKRQLLVILALLLFILVVFLILYINNNKNLEQKKLWEGKNITLIVNNNKNQEQKDSWEEKIDNNEKLEQKESLIETGNCFKPKEMWIEYDWKWEYDIVKGKVLIMKKANNKRGYDVVTTQINPETFKIIGSWYTKDKDNIYYAGEKIDWVDYCSFEISMFWKNSQNIAWIARDKDHIYKAWKIFEEADIKTFIKKWNSYFIDKNHVYTSKWDIIEWSDPESFNYYKKWNFFYDKNYIYYFGINVPWADYETFQYTWLWFIFKDKNNIYFKSNKIDWVDVVTFKEVSNLYFKDKNHLYTARWEIIKSIDVNSYYLILQTQVLFDKKWLYLSSWKYFPWADAKSFIWLWDSYYKDVRSIYYSKSEEEWEGYIIINIDNVDLTSFLNIGWGYAKDKNRVYYEGIVVENSDPNSCKNVKECSNNYPQT